MNLIYIEQLRLSFTEIMYPHTTKISLGNEINKPLNQNQITFFGETMASVFKILGIDFYQLLHKQPARVV